MTDGTTHREGCWKGGPEHYECALARIQAIKDAVPSPEGALDDEMRLSGKFILEYAGLLAAINGV